jgi:hypothetical protein
MEARFVAAHANTGDPKPIEAYPLMSTRADSHDA